MRGKGFDSTRASCPSSGNSRRLVKFDARERIPQVFAVDLT
jgi:hypothetical protein